MAERRTAQVYSIAAHRGFADALVAGLIPRYAQGDFGLARLTLLLPSARAQRVVTEAFVRLSGGGMLLPRMVMVGDLDLDETLGPLLDPLGAESTIPPAADPTRRWLRLAELLRQELGDEAPALPGLLRLARETAQTLDRLAIEGIGIDRLLEDEVLGILGQQAEHWQKSARLFLRLKVIWQDELARRGEVDPPVRRNLLFDNAARRWRESAPEHPLVAAGITSASPALARLLRQVCMLPRGAVVLPDLDLGLDDDIWDMLGRAGIADAADQAQFGEADALAHPQYHLKLLLGRMGINRGEVEPWHRAGLAAAAPERSRAISSLFLPSAASAGWVDLPARERRLAGVRLMECAHPGEEAQAIAILIREALEIPERRIAVITPNRNLARRIIDQFQRWNINADDSAGIALAQTLSGRLALLLAQVLASAVSPVDLLALLVHPRVCPGEGRAGWLENARRLDLALRGPRPAPGLEPIRSAVRKLARRDAGIADWWARIEAVLVPLLEADGERPLFERIGGIIAALEALCGSSIWGEADGRALAAQLEDLRESSRQVGTLVAPEDLPAVLRDAMDQVTVRPAWGQHPRLAIYGLLEARMSRADLTICAGLSEGSWPASPAPEPLLPPRVLRVLGIPSGEFRIGLAAHDLAGALGGPEVVLSWAQRDEDGPVIPSRFVLRIEAMLGELAEHHRETRAVELARMIDHADAAPAYPQPKPRPSPEQRNVALAVTAIDRLRSDPYQFYAAQILRLRKLDALDGEPTPPWKGNLVHKVMERWHRSGGRAGELLAIAAEELAQMQAHPLVRSLWWPRLAKGLEWIDQTIALQRGEGRRVIASEIKGEMSYRGVRLHGRADRIDRCADGSLAIVDYKTGTPPRGKMVEKGFALQLGTIGLIAADGGFAGVVGEPQRFEYWSLAKPRQAQSGQFGFSSEPVREGNRKGLIREEFLSKTREFLDLAIDGYILGMEPFTARLNPDLGGYTDYDQLMRLDEWQARMERSE